MNLNKTGQRIWKFVLSSQFNFPPFTSLLCSSTSHQQLKEEKRKKRLKQANQHQKAMQNNSYEEKWLETPLKQQ